MKLLSNVMNKLTARRNRRNAINELNRMTDDQLRDIGINRWNIESTIRRGSK